MSLPLPLAARLLYAHALSSHSSNPATGAQKSFEIDDEHKTRCFVDKRMGQDVDISSLGEQFKGYVVRIGGANDKQGFPAKREWGLLRREKRRGEARRSGGVGPMRRCWEWCYLLRSPDCSICLGSTYHLAAQLLTLPRLAAQRVCLCRTVCACCSARATRATASAARASAAASRCAAAS